MAPPSHLTSLLSVILSSREIRLRASLARFSNRVSFFFFIKPDGKNEFNKAKNSTELQPNFFSTFQTCFCLPAHASLLIRLIVARSGKESLYSLWKHRRSAASIDIVICPPRRRGGGKECEGTGRPPIRFQSASFLPPPPSSVRKQTLADYNIFFTGARQPGAVAGLVRAGPRRRERDGEMELPVEREGDGCMKI